MLSLTKVVPEAMEPTGHRLNLYNHEPKYISLSLFPPVFCQSDKMYPPHQWTVEQDFLRSL